MAKASLITQVGANYLEKADNLSDVADKDTSKLNLEVPNVGTAANEVSVNGMLGDLAFQSSAGVVVDDLTVDGELIAAVGKPMPVNGPSMRFDGSNDYVEFADNDAFSFTNGTDDLPFSVGGFVKASNIASFRLTGKYGTSSSVREWVFMTDGSGKLNLITLDSSGNSPQLLQNSPIVADTWYHIFATYAGAGPNSSNAFSAAANGMKIYVNGADITSECTSTNNAGYGGMSNTAQALWLGRGSTLYAKGEIRDVKLFNKELSAAEVKEVYSNGQLPDSFAESTGAIAYASDFSSGVDGVVTYGGTGVGNIDGIGGKNDNLRFTVDSASANHQFSKNYGSLIADGKSARVSAEIYIPSTNTQITRVQVNSDGTANVDVIGTVTATNAWTSVSGVFTKDYPDIRFRALAGTSAVFVGNGSDVFYVRNVRVTQIGAVLDARAEQFDTSTGKLYDLSGNDFVGTQSGGVSLLGREFPVYETGTWTPSVSFASSTTGLSIANADGRYTRCGDTVFVTGRLQFDVGSSSGNMSITGLPYSVATGTYNNSCGGVSFASGLAALTSHVTLKANVGTSEITPYDWAASGTTRLTEANFGANSTLYFSLTYKIS